MLFRSNCLYITMMLCLFTCASLFCLQVNTDGHLARMDEWYSQSSSGHIRCAGSNNVACEPSVSACMFDLRTDPCEQRNIYGTDEYIQNELWKAMQDFNASSVKYTTPVSPDYRGDPANFGYAWQIGRAHV